MTHSWIDGVFVSNMWLLMHGNCEKKAFLFLFREIAIIFCIPSYLKLRSEKRESKLSRYAVNWSASCGRRNNFTVIPSRKTMKYSHLARTRWELFDLLLCLYFLESIQEPHPKKLHKREERLATSLNGMLIASVLRNFNRSRNYLLEARKCSTIGPKLANGVRSEFRTEIDLGISITQSS